MYKESVIVTAVETYVLGKVRLVTLGGDAVGASFRLLVITIRVSLPGGWLWDDVIVGPPESSSLALQHMLVGSWGLNGSLGMVAALGTYVLGRVRLVTLEVDAFDAILKAWRATLSSSCVYPGLYHQIPPYLLLGSW